MTITRRRRAFWRALRRGLGWGVLGLLTAAGAAVIGVPAATGSTPLAVLTGSMEPSLPPGTLVVVRPVPTEEIRLGDVLTYQMEPGNPAVVSHRVIEVRSVSDGTVEFITQGDNNNAPDPAPVSASQVKGTVWYSLPLVGWVSIAVGSYGSWLAPIAGAGLLAYAVILFLGGVVARMQRTRASTAALQD